RQLRGGGAARVVAGLASTAGGTLRALVLLGELRPRLVVGVGGYASVAVVIAAALRRVPTVLLEQNVVPGAANRVLARLARRICVGFAESIAFLPRARAVHTGNPVLAARVEPFIADMGAAYAAADLVVARAGATTCAELTAVGLPAILVPYPYAADDHQRRNAEVLVRAG